MAGKHEAPGTGEFWAGLIRYVTLIVLGTAVVVALIFSVWKLLPIWFPSDDQPLVSASSLLAGDATTTITTEAGVQPVRTTATTQASVTPSTAPASTSTTSSTTSSTTTTSTTVPDLRDPGEITVKVLNSTTTKGLAAGLSSDLAAAGYQMEPQDNYRPTLEETLVYYAPGYQGEAFALAEFVPGATVAVNPAAAPSVDLLVILGTSYSG